MPLMFEAWVFIIVMVSGGRSRQRRYCEPIQRCEAQAPLPVCLRGKHLHEKTHVVLVDWRRFATPEQNCLSMTTDEQVRIGYERV